MVVARSRSSLIAVLVLAAACSSAVGAGGAPGAVPEAAAADNPTARGADASASAAWQAAVDSAVVGVTDPGLAGVLREHWAMKLRRAPTFATQLGVRDFDDRLADGSEAARLEAVADRDRWLRVVRSIDPEGLGAEDRLNRALFVADLEVAAAMEACRGWEWNIGVQSNPVTGALGLHEGFGLDTPADGRNLIARYRAVGGAIDQAIEHLRRGANGGRYATQQSLRRLVELVDRQLAVPVEQWAMLEPVERVPESWSEGEREEFGRELQAAVRDDVMPAFVRYRDFVRDDLLPSARGPQAPGVSALPGGRACYEAMILHHTTLPLTAKEIHSVGLAEVKRINAEMVELGRRALGTKTLAGTIGRLRDDRSLYFGTSEEVEAAAVAGLAAAKAAMPRFFGITPKADCVVRRVPDFEAPATHIGYYNPPHADGSKPGEYFINVYAPTTRPRFEARVLAVHESIPGHHLQIAIAIERDALPAFRRFAGYSAFVEGWALYTERLAEEMGLYESDLDRMGMLSFDAWRASRLVVDTGIHAMGWTREQAETFMLEHTALTPGNITNEVDRYIGWPGQALGYKIGQLEMWRLRREAEAAMGERFSVAGFHDVVLGGGPLPLGEVERRVVAWTQAQ